MRNRDRQEQGARLAIDAGIDWQTALVSLTLHLVMSSDAGNDKVSGDARPQTAVAVMRGRQ
jgi:hypothetical protein